MIRIKGNKALANELCVSTRTIQKWRKEGILDEATIADFRRTIIYNLDKVFECLHNNPMKPGRPKKSYL